MLRSTLKNLLRPRDNFSMRKNLCCFIWRLKTLKQKLHTNLKFHRISSNLWDFFTVDFSPCFFSLTKKTWLGPNLGEGHVTENFDRGRCHWNLSFWAYSRDFVTYLKLIFWWHGNLHTKNPMDFCNCKRLFIFFGFVDVYVRWIILICYIYICRYAIHFWVSPSQLVTRWLYIYIYMDVSENNGTPKSSILIGFSIINHPFGVPLFLETPNIYIYI